MRADNRFTFSGVKRLGTALALMAFTGHCQLAHAEDWWEKAKELVQESPKTETKQSQASFSEIEQAFKQALTIGSETVVSQLGQNNGFNSDPSIHIPLPKELAAAAKMLDKVGLGSLSEDLELQLNRAAEQATPKAKQLFLTAIKEMSFEDIQTIYQGPKDSATQYFKKTMSQSLATEMKPIVEQSLSQVGAISTYDDFTASYKTIPFVPDLKSNLTQHNLANKYLTKGLW